MKIIRAIAGRIFAVWAILMFIATMLIFLVPFLLFSYTAKDPKKTMRFASFARIWMGIYLPLIGCPLTVRGRNNFAPGQNYVVICNHNSLMDVPISYPGIPGGNKTIAKSEMAKIPLFGLIYSTGSILVNRKSEQSRKESYLQMRRVLDMGLHMCLYPEGTRNKTDQPLKAFHDGAFRLAKESGKSIIPGVIFHTRTVLPADKTFFFIPHKLEMHFLPPIEVQATDTTESLKTKAYNTMWEYYIKHARK
jgi:1-acyl-sn-glycerol-3-phosphate acyltransferase